MTNVNIEPFKVIGISVRTTNENNQAAIDIGGLWNWFMEEQVLEAIPNKIDHTIYSIYTAYESDHTKPYTTILGCKVSSLNSIPEGMIGHTVAGGTYLNFNAKGSLMEGLVINKWQEIWQMELGRTYTSDFEIYGEKAHNPADAEVDILIAVR